MQKGASFRQDVEYWSCFLGRFMATVLIHVMLDLHLLAVAVASLCHVFCEKCSTVANRAGRCEQSWLAFEPVCSSRTRYEVANLGSKDKEKNVLHILIIGS